MSSKQDFKNVVISLISRFSYQFFSMLIMFLMTPFLIVRLGDYQYGLWLLLTALIQYVGLVEFGVTSAVQRNLAIAAGENNQTEFNRVLNNGLLLNMVIFFLITLLSCLAYGVIHYLKIKDYALISTLVLIMGINFAQTFPFKTFSSVLNAHIRFDLLSQVMTIQLLLNNLAVVLSIIYGYGLVTMAWTTLATTFISSLLYIVHAYKIAGFIRLRVSEINQSTVKNLLGYSWKTVLLQISGLLRMRMDEFVIAAFISVPQVTYYSVSSKLIGGVHNLCGILMSVMTPLIAKNHKTKSQQQKIQFFYFSSKVVMAFFSLILFSIIYLGQSLILTWAGPKYHVVYPTLVILGLYAFLSSINIIGSNYMYAEGTHHYLGYIGLLEGVLNLACSIIFVKYFNWGLAGVALGSLIPGILFKLVFQPILNNKTIHYGIGGYYKFLLNSFLLAGLIYLPCGLLSLFFSPRNYYQLFLYILGFMLLSIAHLGILLNKQERGYLSGELLKLIKFLPRARKGADHDLSTPLYQPHTSS